ncbi:MAG: NAD(P)-dependent alcohol dehydrogenase [Gemmataceae bacterium]
MRAYELNGGFGFDHLSLVERPTPTPGPGQVQIRLRAVSLNYRDLLVIKGLYNPRLPLPRIPVSDGAGEITALGPGVTRFKLGDRVAAAFMPAWVEGRLTDDKARSALGGLVDGLLCETAVLPETGVVAVPGHLCDEEAATLPCAALTAWNALRAGNVQPGETVLVQGTGGVSLFALQLARLHGARVIATSSSDEKLQRVRQLGVQDTLNYRTVPEWGDAVRKLTSGGVDHIVEVGGAGTLNQSLRAVRTAGHIALIGVLAGYGECNPVPILMKAVRVTGIFVGSVADFEAMNRAITLAGMRPVIDRVFAFEQAIEALRHLESGNHMGKVVIRV